MNPTIQGWLQLAVLILTVAGSIAYQTHYVDKRIDDLRDWFQAVIESEKSGLRTEITSLQTEIASLRDVLGERLKRIEERIERLEHPVHRS